MVQGWIIFPDNCAQENHFLNKFSQSQMKSEK